jgi:hypothetical protein
VQHGSWVRPAARLNAARVVGSDVGAMKSSNANPKTSAITIVTPAVITASRAPSALETTVAVNAVLRITMLEVIEVAAS